MSFYFADIGTYVRQRSQNLCIGGAALFYGCFRRTIDAGIFHGLHGFGILLHDVGRTFRDFQLAVQHQQCIIQVGCIGNQLYSGVLLVSLGLFQSRFGHTLGIQQLAEEVNLPAGGYRQGVGLCGFSFVPAGDSTLW